MTKKEATQRENVDYGDDLTEEQKAAAMPEDKLSDEEVEAALNGLNEEDGAKQETQATETASEEAQTESEKAEETRIPKSRFDEAVNAERAKAAALQERLDALEAQLQQNSQPQQPTAESNEPTIDDEIEAAATEVMQKRTEWQAAILDNDGEKANKLLEEMTAAERNLQDLRDTKVSQSTRQVTNEDTAFNNQLAALEKTYPQINPDAEGYDKKLDQRLGALFTGFVNSGMSRRDALNEARDILLVPMETKTETPTKENKKDETEKTLREKTGQSLSKAIEGQPPNAQEIGRPATKEPALQPSRMTRKQFSKLSEEQLSKLRGDTL